MAIRLSRLNGIQTFTLIWFGQMVSMLGTAMTRFALIIWAYQQTGNATTLALLGFFGFMPYVLLSPIAGVWVDRWDRRRVMMLADLGAGAMTFSLLVLYTTGGLEIWHLYLAEGLMGAFEAFQIPAYHATTSVLVPKQHYGRASGMRSLAQSASEVLAPAFAGVLLLAVDINGVMLIDVLTCGVAILTLLVVRVPRPAVTAEGLASRGNVRHEIAFGFRYIYERKGLLGLMLIFTAMSLFVALAYYGIMPAMILTRSGGDQIALATVQGALGLAGVVGGLAVSAFGLPRRKIHAVLGMGVVSFFFGDLLFAVGQSLPVWILAAVASAFFIPYIVGGERAIWQLKVAPDVQGRVFAVQGMFSRAMSPVGYLLAGPLADQILEPAMAAGGSLTGVFGGLVGVGPGAGMGLIFGITWLGGTLVCLSGYFVPAIRNVETDLPDYDAAMSDSEAEIREEVVAAAV